MADESKHFWFQEQLRSSHPWVERVARWISATWGVPVEVNPLRIAPTRAEAAQYRDQGDLVFSLPGEVKHLTCEFVTPEGKIDWPFPNVIVCKKDAWDEARPKPLRFYYVNSPGTHVAVLSSDTRADWWVGQVTDRRTGETQTVYYTKVENLRFFRMGEEPAP